MNRLCLGSLRVMLVGWVIGASVFGLSWLRARSVVSLARERALAIWNKPQDVNPATLPEDVRLALLALIESKQQHLLPEYGVKPKLSPEEMAYFKSSPRVNLVNDFVRLGNPSQTYSLAILGGPTPAQSVSKPSILVLDDFWLWFVEADLRESWSDYAGDNWWFVDPATGRAASKDLSDLGSDMEWVNFSAMIAFVFSLPWLWYFLLIQLDEGSRESNLD